jgi:hypothetical protein
MHEGVKSRFFNVEYRLTNIECRSVGRRRTRLLHSIPIISGRYFVVVKTAFYLVLCIKIGKPADVQANIGGFLYVQATLVASIKYRQLKSPVQYYLLFFLGVKNTNIRLPSIFGKPSGVPKSSKAWINLRSNNCPRSWNVIPRPLN